jgi:hypothetical protein
LGGSEADAAGGASNNNNLLFERLKFDSHYRRMSEGENEEMSA